MHFFISELISNGVYGYLALKGRLDLYNRHVMELVGISAILSILFLLPFSWRDQWAREMGGLIPSRKEKPSLSPFLPLLMIFIGAGLCQYGNILVSMVFSFLPQGSYFNDMAKVTNGQTLWAMLFWIGVIGPIGEEFVFRRMLFCRLRDHHGALFSVLISALFFGIYHGNLLQAIYAFLLGSLFSLAYECTGSFLCPVLLHICANSWGIVLSIYLEKFLFGKGMPWFLFLSCAFLIANVVGWTLMLNIYKARGKRRLV